jgi:hypothetical protein
MPKSTPRKASRNRVFATIPNYNPKTPKNPVSEPHPKPQETGFLRQYLTTTQKLRKTRFLNTPRKPSTKFPRLSYNQNHHPHILTTHHEALAPGQQLHQGKYLIEEILGCGGFGVTYRAQNRKEGKAVAIKTLNANVQCKPNFQELQTKFLNEALSLAKCSHPHVVQVYEVFPKR